MREIKFRAWDGEKYITFDNHEYDLVFNDISGWNVKPNLPNYKGEYTCGESQSKTPDFVLEQYTGLTDINGKEIYEGDILKWIGTTGDNEGVKFNNVVYFLSYRYRIKGTRNKKTFHADLNSNQIFNHKCEVIGNIHEHKHLLK